MTIESSGDGRSQNRHAEQVEDDNNDVQKPIHAHQMAFTFILISRLDKAGYQVTFKMGMCTIFNLKGQIIATIPHSDGLYRIIGKHDKDRGMAAVASRKMSISEAHRKLGHLAYGAVTHAISKGYIAGIDLDTNSNWISVMHVQKQKWPDNHS